MASLELSELTQWPLSSVAMFLTLATCWISEYSDDAGSLKFFRVQRVMTYSNMYPT